jgi:hypothetical protein
MIQRRVVGIACVAFAANAFGCASDASGGTVGARTVLVDRSTQNLIGSVTSINGTYGAGCIGHKADGTDPWSATNDATGTLSVVRANAGCVLTLTDVVTVEDTFTAAPAIILDDAYSAVSTFTGTVDASNAFYGTAMQTEAGVYDQAFKITLIFADQPSVLDGGEKTADYEMLGSSVVTYGAEAPDYTFTNTLAVETNALKIVTQVSGAVILSAGPASLTGQSYLFVDGVPADKAAIDLLFTEPALGKEPIVGVPPTSPTEIQGELIAATNNLTTQRVRSLIIARTTGNDAGPTLNAYQVFTFKFNAPTP